MDPGAIRVQELTAKGGAVFAVAAVCLLLGLSLNHMIFPGGDAYDEYY